MDLQLKGRVAVVMAASKGLGAATARIFAQEGARVVVSARNGEVLARTAHDIAAETGAQVIPVVADSSRAEDIDRLMATTRERFARIDALVVNAGGPPAGQFMDFDDMAWQAAIQLTLMSAVRAARAVIPVMRTQGGGSITFIESYGIKHVLDNLLFSNSLRLAVIGMAKTLSHELGPEHIRVNVICPGSTETDRIRSLAKTNAQRNGSTVEEEITRMGKSIPLGRIGQPEEFGRACVFLASPVASFINGAALMVDGGASRVM